MSDETLHEIISDGCKESYFKGYEYAVDQQARIAELESKLNRLREEGKRAASNACRIGQIPSKHYPIFWENENE